MTLKSLKIYAIVGLLVAFSGCKLDLLDNPNAVTPQNTSPDLLLNRIQIDLAGWFNGVSDPGMRLTRMLNQGQNVYANSYTPQNLDGVWNVGYANIMTDVNTLIPIAEKSNLLMHAGIARIIKAYVAVTLVDYFGDVPYSEAIDANNFNPNPDKGADIYTKSLADLDKAIENINATSAANPADLFYNGNKDSWIRLANSMKLKLLLTRRLVDNGAKASIDALITGNRLLSTTAQSFAFKYSSTLANPDSRHPRYAGQYTPSGGGDYHANFYMWSFHEAKGFPDPRTRYFFYRQTTLNTSNVNELRCINNQKPPHYSNDMVFCLPTNVGYWGRDHLSNEGIPPDGLRRTAWGLYPAGGRYDNNAGVPVGLQVGAQGAGIAPIMMSSFVDFMLAESALVLGTQGNPKALLESAVRKSMTEVRNMAMGSSEAGVISAFEAAQNINWNNEVGRYVTKVLELYDAAASNDAKLDVICREYWLALHGNGVEAYNMYRRTGKPANMQPALEPNPGNFVRTFYYPAVYVGRNANAKQKTNVEVPVFWDTNPVGFVK